MSKGPELQPEDLPPFVRQGIVNGYSLNGHASENETLEHSRRAHWIEVIPTRASTAAQIAHWLALAFFAVSLAGLRVSGGRWRRDVDNRRRVCRFDAMAVRRPELAARL